MKNVLYMQKIKPHFIFSPQIYKGSGTAGGIAVKDVDGDGFAEVFIPSYTAKQIVVMSYRPDGP